jgi:hypothetical protein
MLLKKLRFVGVWQFYPFGVAMCCVIQGKSHKGYFRIYFVRNQKY